MYIQHEARFPNVNAYRYMPASGARRKSTAILVLPGILNRWNEQVGPVIDTLALYGDVFGVNYTAKSWDSQPIVDNITDFVDHELSRYERLVIFGISIGGMITPDIVGATKRSDDSIYTVIVEAPYGADTLRPLPPALRPLYKYAGGLSILNGPVGNWIRETKMSVLPKRENIELPAGVADITGYQDQIIDLAKLGLSNHTWRMMNSQNVYMARHDPQASLLTNVKTVYVACISTKNDTVVQPKALNRWRLALPNLKVIEVDTAHAAFLEAQPTWQPKLVETFSLLGLPANN